MLSAIGWFLLGLTSATAVALGVRWHRPTRMSPWLLLCGAVAAMAIGDVCYALDLQPSADIAYYAMFPLIAVALSQFTRSGALLVDRARLIDLLAFTCAALLVAWVVVVGGTGITVSAHDTLGDVVLMVVTARLVVAARGNRSAVLLCLGAAGLLGGDLAYALSPAPASEAGYVAFYLAWGAAALHPSMTALSRPTVPRPPPWRSRYAALLGLSVATPPTVLLIQAVTGTVTDGVVIAVAAGITLMLAITRLTDSLEQHSRALTRERGLREASAALVAAADVPSVDHAVRAAVAQLLPGDAHTLTLATDDRQLTMRAVPSADGPSRLRSWWQDTGAGGSRPGAAHTTLVCPLWLEPLAVARPSGGALVLAGPHDKLAATRDALEVLAGQTALALDRISLVEAVGRRDSDLYLQAVIRNTADLMLVIDEDQHIRYASPDMNALLGTKLGPLETLQDLVIPDDRGTVTRALLAGDDGEVCCALQRPDGGQMLVEATYRDLRDDRLVQGFVISFRQLTVSPMPSEQMPYRAHLDDLPAQVNRRSARDKFKY